jgi:ABC-type multidrug transport system, permease component
MNSVLIAQNIIRRALKSKRELLFMLLLPVIAIMIMTYMTGPATAGKVPAGIVNLDKGEYGGKIVSHVKDSEGLSVVELNEGNYRESVKKSDVNFVVIIPEGFSDSIENGKKAEVVFYGAGVSEISEKLKQDINQYITDFYLVKSVSADIAVKSGVNNKDISNSLYNSINEGSISVSYRQLNNAEMSRISSSIGFALMFIMVLIFSTIGTIMEDKRNLTLARICTFKVKDWEVALGNLLGSLTMGIIQLIPITAFIGVIYKTKLPYLLGLFAVLVCFDIAAIGLGIGISGLVKEDFNPSLIIAEVIFPTSLLGGCLIPESMLPSFMNKIGFLVPQKWVMAAISDVTGGAAIQDIAFKLGIILMFGLAFAVFGAKTIKPINE